MASTDILAIAAARFEYTAASDRRNMSNTPARLLAFFSTSLFKAPRGNMRPSELYFPCVGSILSISASEAIDEIRSFIGFVPVS